MQWALYVVEAAGILVVAASVRMVAGRTTAFVSLACMTAMAAFDDTATPILFPAAILTFLLLSADRYMKWNWRLVAIVSALLYSCAVNWLAIVLVPVVALSIAFRLRLHRRPATVFIGSAIAVAILVFALETSRNGVHFAALTSVQIVLALPSTVWLLLGLRQMDGISTAIAGVPVALLVADDLAARLLLIASAICLMGLLLKSYRLKR